MSLIYKHLIVLVNQALAAPPALSKNLSYQKNEINCCRRTYKGVPGIYLFSSDDNSYLGSSKNLFTRCFTQHKNNAFTQISKHSKFYNNVVTNS